MTLICGIEQLKNQHAPCVASIGNYDGVHLGHQHVIQTLLDFSQSKGVKSTVITFEPLAKEFFSAGAVHRLTSIEERAQLLFELGVDQVLCIDFNAKFASYSPRGFVQDVLINGLGVQHLCVGDDFRFGKDRAGDFDFLTKMGQHQGFAVTAHDTFELDGHRVSSGRARQALANADFDLAERLLGRRYCISGMVSQGQQLGRTIGFPTANIVLPDYLMPINGVFAVIAELETGEQVSGVANLGIRPTLDGKENRLEVHLFNFNDDLYGKKMRVNIIQKIREEKKFDSFDHLKQQIQKDASLAKGILGVI